MDLSKWRQDLSDKKFTDVEIKLVDIRNEITFSCHKSFLAFGCEFFHNFLLFNDAKGDYRVEVTDAKIAYDVIMSLYGTEIKIDRTQWLYVLKLFQIRDYFCLPNDISMLYELDIPSGGTDMLLNIIESYDIINDKQLMKLIKRTIPTDYDFGKLNDEFIRILLCFGNNFFASCGNDHNVKMWSEIGCNNNAEFDEHTDGVYGIDVSHDKKYLVTCSKDRSVIIYDIDAYDIIYKFQDDICVNAVAFLHDNKQIVVGKKNGVMEIWDIKTGKTIASEHVHPKYVMTIKISPSGKLIASSSCNQKIMISDIFLGRMGIIYTNTPYLYDIAFTPDSKFILASGTARNDKIIMWNLKKLYGTMGCKSKKTILNNSDLITSVSFSSDGKLLATASIDGLINIYDFLEMKLVQTFNTEIELTIIRFARNNDAIISGDAEGNIKTWSLSMKRMISNIPKAHNGRVRNIAIIGHNESALEEKMTDYLLEKKIEDSNGK